MAMDCRPEILLHLNLTDTAGWRGQERLGFFARVAEICESHGLPFRVLPRLEGSTNRSTAVPDGNLHIVQDGQLEGEGWLNAALAYLLGYWHLDPYGVLADSAARTARFTASEVHWQPAQEYFQNLRQRFANARVSRYHQQQARTHDLPQGSVAVFLQGRAPYKAGHCDVPMHQIILAACQGAQGRPVVVKPHPLAIKDCAFAIARAADEGAAFQLFDGNIHDLLATCAVTVSVNSAAAMEGFLHRKPAILFGRSDFADLVTRAHHPQDFAAALETALGTQWPYARMLYWYFTRHTLQVASPSFEDSLFTAFARVGYSRQRLGL